VNEEDKKAKLTKRRRLHDRASRRVGKLILKSRGEGDHWWSRAKNEAPSVTTDKGRKVKRG